MSPRWEVEQKFVVADVAALRDQLAKQGYALTSTEEHCDIYFRHPCRDLKATDEAFRLRTVDHQCCITYKGERLPGPVKTRPEIELEVNSRERESWLAMLQHLGFVPLPAVRKRRHNFAAQKLEADDLAKILVTLDEVEFLGNFAELELIVTAAVQLDSAGRRISQLAAQLQLVTVQPSSYLSLVLEKLGES